MTDYVKRYIDANALENRVEDFEELIGMKLNIIHDFVSSQPTADVRENIRGKWITHTEDNTRFSCSACGADFHGTIGFIFCPNCGANMKEK